MISTFPVYIYGNKLERRVACQGDARGSSLTHSLTLPERGSCTATRSALTAAWSSQDRVTSHQSLLSYTFIAVDPSLQNSADIPNPQEYKICLCQGRQLTYKFVLFKPLYQCMYLFVIGWLMHWPVCKLFQMARTVQC